MKSFSHKGQLIIWKDDRGFGFIKPNNDNQKVFLHISVLSDLSRRPKVGDLILYEQIKLENGKIRATKATIQGVKYRYLSSKRKRKKPGLPKTFIGVPIVFILALFIIEFYPSRSPSLIQSITKPECKIKGNISINTGRKLYHLPGMEGYNSTVIDRTKGEKWFCQESEAIANGWNKAPR